MRSVPFSAITPPASHDERTSLRVPQFVRVQVGLPALFCGRQMLATLPKGALFQRQYKIELAWDRLGMSKTNWVG
jgi:hypothetical protein